MLYNEFLTRCHKNLKYFQKVLISWYKLAMFKLFDQQFLSKEGKFCLLLSSCTIHQLIVPRVIPYDPLYHLYNSAIFMFSNHQSKNNLRLKRCLAYNCASKRKMLKQIDPTAIMSDLLSWLSLGRMTTYSSTSFVRFDSKIF